MPSYLTGGRQQGKSLINEMMIKYYISKFTVGGLPTKKLAFWIKGKYIIWDTDGMLTTYEVKHNELV